MAILANDIYSANIYIPFSMTKIALMCVKIISANDSNVVANMADNNI